MGRARTHYLSRNADADWRIGAVLQLRLMTLHKTYRETSDPHPDKHSKKPQMWFCAAHFIEDTSSVDLGFASAVCRKTPPNLPLIKDQTDICCETGT